MANTINRVYETMKGVYGRPKYLLLNAVILVVYYYLYNFLISLQQNGAVIVLLPIYLLYLLIITSSMAMTIGIYSIRNSRSNEAKELSTSFTRRDCCFFLCAYALLSECPRFLLLAVIVFWICPVFLLVAI